MYKDHLLLSSILVTENLNGEANEGEAEEPDVPQRLISGLGLVFLVVSAGVVFVILAGVINKLRKKQSFLKSRNRRTSHSSKMAQGGDCREFQMQLSTFPKDSNCDWKKWMKDNCQKTGHKLTGKYFNHSTTIPEHLKHQLKRIYVY